MHQFHQLETGCALYYPRAEIAKAKTDSSLMQVESIAECSLNNNNNNLLEHSAVPLTCIRQQSVLKTNFFVFFGHLRQVLLYISSVAPAGEVTQTQFSSSSINAYHWVWKSNPLKLKLKLR